MTDIETSKNLKCVYMIKNLINGKAYVGSSTCLRRRFKQHREELRGNYHKNRKLQNSWNKYKEKSFEFSLLEEIEDVNKLFIR